MTDHPYDRFDRAPADLARVGAHRAPRRRGRGWIAFAWAALATGLLVGAGVLWLAQIDRQVADTGSTRPSSAAVVATVSPKSPVLLLNATATAGLAAEAKKTIAAKGWTVQSIGNASSTDFASTTVYYAEKSAAGAALGLAKSLGSTRTTYSQQFAAGGKSRLVVLLGKDFAAKHR